MNNYKSALDKLKLKQSEKEKAKALFHEVKQRKEYHMGVRKLWKPVAVLAASLACVIALHTVVPALQTGKTDNSAEKALEKYFSITAYAKELSKTGKVFPNKQSAKGYGLCEGVDANNNSSVSFAFDFPLQCKGKNIETVTYGIEKGAFQISNPKGKSIVVKGEKLDRKLEAPAATLVDDAEEIQYKSFTVNYDKQTDKKTAIDVIGDTNEIWGKAEREQYKKLGGSILGLSLQEKKKLFDLLVKDLGISCTVTYKDGTKETKHIVVSNDIMRPSEVLEEEVPEERNEKTVFQNFSIR